MEYAISLYGDGIDKFRMSDIIAKAITTFQAKNNAIMSVAA